MIIIQQVLTDIKTLGNKIIDNNDRKLWNNIVSNTSILSTSILDLYNYIVGKKPDFFDYTIGGKIGQ